MAIEELMNDFVACAQATLSVNYADKKSVRQFNAKSDRMRTIVDQVVNLGQGAVTRFATLVDSEPAATWAAPLLVEKAELDAGTLAKCFARVEQGMAEAEAKGALADAMIKEMWLKEWKSKRM